MQLLNNVLRKNVWVVYMLECIDHSYYIGITNNLEARITKHNEGKGAKYTRGRRPVTLLKSWNFTTKSEALKEEYRLKQLTKSQKIELLNLSQ